MNNLICMFTNSDILSIAGIALGIIIIAVLAFFIAKKSGLKFVNAVESVIVFVKNLLLQLGFDNAKVDSIIDLLLKAISYALAINETADIDSKVKVSMDFLNNILQQLKGCNGTKITLDDTEISAIQTVFKLTFIFINTLEISHKSVAYKLH